MNTKTTSIYSGIAPSGKDELAFQHFANTVKNHNEFFIFCYSDHQDRFISEIKNTHPNVQIFLFDKPLNPQISLGFNLIDNYCEPLKSNHVVYVINEISFREIHQIISIEKSKLFDEDGVLLEKYFLDIPDFIYILHSLMSFITTNKNKTFFYVNTFLYIDEQLINSHSPVPTFSLDYLKIFADFLQYVDTFYFRCYNIFLDENYFKKLLKKRSNTLYLFCTKGTPKQEKLTKNFLIDQHIQAKF